MDAQARLGGRVRARVTPNADRSIRADRTCLAFQAPVVPPLRRCPLWRRWEAPTGRCAIAQTSPSTGLAHEAIGLREVLFQSITHMAPAAAVAFSIIVGAQFAGGALPLAVVLVLGYLGVTISAGTGTVLGIFEIGVFLALALWLIVKAGNANTLAVFGTG